MKPSQKLVIAGLAVIGIVAISALILKKKAPQEPSGEQANVGRYFDWNLSDGFGKEQILPMIAERLVEKSNSGDFYISRLAKEVKYENEVATIVLREAVYWSDQTPLTAQQVFDAYERRSRSKHDFSDANEKQLTQLMKTIALTVIGKDTIKIEGLRTEDALYQLITSFALSPIRKDLIEKEQDQAWRITLGAYTPWAIQEVFEADETLRLVVNPYYYRGAKPEDLILTPSKFPRINAQAIQGS